MSVIVKARGSQGGDKTMMGDAQLNWDMIMKDNDHGHFMVCTYDRVTDRILVMKAGIAPASHSSHDVVAEEVQTIAGSGQAVWGAYSWRSVQNAKPGQKSHTYHTAVMLVLPKNCPDKEKIVQIKNRVKSFVFEGCGLYMEVQDATYMDDPDFWMRKRAIHPKGTRYSDFGGGHTHAQEDCAHAKMVKDISQSKERMSVVANERKSKVFADCDAEQTRKVGLWQQAIKLAEDLRKKNREEAKKAIIAEQERRVKEEGTKPNERHMKRVNTFKDELLGHDAKVKGQKAAKTQTRKELTRQVTLRQEELVAQWNAKEEEMQKLRAENAALCKKILEAEQRRRVSHHDEEYVRSAMAKEFTSSIKHELVEAHELMERGVNQRGAKLAMDQEKRERCAEGRTPTPEYQLKRQLTHKELLEKVRKSQ